MVQQFQEEYSHYTDLLELHPMELVGKEVPPIDGSDQMVVFRTTAEAKEYQEAVKTVLGRMMRSEVERLREEDAEVISVVHNSIELFQANPDLVPGSKSFNRELADEVMSLVEPYALRMDGKLTGFSIDIQGIIDQTRGRLKQRAAAQPPPAPAKKAAPKRKPASPPQGGIASKAGTSGGEVEDFSPMWAALGINSMPI